jgi:16S rRNA processing protein RimM
MELIHFGNIVASFGVDGTLVIAHACKKKISLQKCKALFIELEKDIKTPYFITKSKAINTTDLQVNVEGIITKEAVKPYLKKRIWLAKEDFDSLVDSNAPVAFLGFTIQQAGKTIGQVIEIIEQPHQILCNVNYKGKQAFIPLHSQTLVGIDRVKQIIEVQLPDGLLEIYE